MGAESEFDFSQNPADMPYAKDLGRRLRIVEVKEGTEGRHGPDVESSREFSPSSPVRSVH